MGNMAPVPLGDTPELGAILAFLNGIGLNVVAANGLGTTVRGGSYRPGA